MDKLLEKYLTEAGSESDFWEAYKQLGNVTDALRDAHNVVGKFDPKEKAKIAKMYNQITKMTMAFVNKHGKEFGAKGITGIRSL